MSKVTKPKAGAPEKASPTSHKPYQTDDNKLSCAREHITVMSNAPSWPTAVVLHPVADSWADTTNKLELKNGEIAALLVKLSGLETERAVLRVTWSADRRQMIAAVNSFCHGNAALIQELGFDERQLSVTAGIVIPTGLATSPGPNEGDVTFVWDDDVNRYGFMVMWATDKENPATFANPIPCPKSPFTLKGQKAGTTSHFRVAAVDPELDGHMTEWSVWQAGTAL